MSIRSIALGLVVLVFLAGAVAASLLFLHKMERDYLEDLEHNLVLTAQTLADNIAPILAHDPRPPGTIRVLQDAVLEIQKDTGSRIRILSVEGTSLCDSLPDIGKVDAREIRTRPEVMAALSRRAGISTGFADENPQSIAMYVAMPSIHQGRLVAIAYISHSTSQIATRIDSLRRPILLAVASLGLLVALLGTAFALTVRNSLDRLRLASSRISGGQLGERLEVPGLDEMADIAGHFNRIASSLQQKVSELESERDKTKRFIQDLTHELKTPLAGLSGSVYALQDGAQDDERQRGLFIANLKRDSDRLGRLVGRLLEIQKLEYDRLKLVKFDMASLVERVADEFEAEASRLGVAFQFSGDDLDVLADPDKIERVLENFVENALRHSPRGGAIAIHTSLHPDGVRVDVSDQGPGVDPADRARLFERFFRGSQKQSGTMGGAGLGLSIASEIIARHGGHIGVTSTSAGGAQFYFTLPVPKTTL